jgi:hypothetical protein
MKTTKITLITALIVLGAMLFGQAEKVQYIYADYSEKSSKFENLVNKFLNKTERTERDGYKEPVVYMSYTMHQADVVYEENYGVEAWMASPFESKYADAELVIENWMTSPFESSYADAELAVENWMTRPFIATDHIEIESWMTAAF